MKFYFQAIVEGIEETLVLCSMYSLPDKWQTVYTHGALHLCSLEREGDLVVMRAKTILSIVGMMLFKETGDFYLTEKFSLGVIDTSATVD